jgi:tetratricopeptide (TPR) repeat protein
MRRTLVIAFALGVAAAAVNGCGRASNDNENQRSVTQLAQPDDVLDEALMLSLSRAKNFHHKANVYLQDGNVDAAIEEVGQILTIPFPAGAPEGQDVLLDARARLGKLLLGQAKQQEALRVVDEGIAASSRESYFLANLYTVRGEILETSAPNAANEDEARQIRRQAIEAFEQSNQMQLKIQKRLMREMGQ